MSVQFAIKPVKKKQKKAHFAMTDTNREELAWPTDPTNRPKGSSMTIRPSYKQPRNKKDRIQNADRWNIQDARPSPKSNSGTSDHHVRSQHNTNASSSREHSPRGVAKSQKYKPSFIPPPLASNKAFSGSRNYTSSSSIRGMASIEESEEEMRKRELRARRFQNDQPIKRQSTTEKEEKEWDMDRKIVGTCTDLEKPYFRLTSAPDPSTVRTKATLKKTLKMLTEAWQEGRHNYTYICEQYKSLRQDLMVQHIRSKFTAKAYEHNARVALEMADLSEYHQCQTQLMYLYTEGVKGSVGEFVAYRILYLIYAGSPGELNTFVQQIKELEEKGRNMGLSTTNVKHALNVREALARDEYHRFFMLYQQVPDRGVFLMDKFVNRTRILALKMLCKAYRLGLELSFICKELAFYSREDMVEFFKEHGVHVREEDNTLDTKAAMPQLIDQGKKYTKVDIKGQL